VSGPYAQGQLLRDIHEIEIALANRFARNGVITDVAEQRSWRERVEDASLGRNTLIYDDQGNPSVMVAVPLMTEADLLTGGRNMPHPAFIVNGITKPLIYVSKYQNITTGSGTTLRALSLKHQDPANSITFDNALLACKQKGTGWHLLTNAEWAAIALWCKKQGFWPRGNNSYGKDYAITGEKGIPSYYYDSGGTKYIGRTLTGSGPVAWSHDGSPFGIFDLNGNVWEWVGGLRLNNGEIQILQDNNAADNTKDQSATSTEWKAILQDGSLVAPGTADTLKYDSTGADSGVSADVGDIKVSTAIINSLSTSYAYNAFQTTAAESGVTIPSILKLLGIFPIDSDHGGDGIWMRNVGERLPLRGGIWPDGSSAGVFALALTHPRSHSGYSIGFRAAFIPV
jgi:hypothetical protein